jgi:hypothetical protein
LSTPMAGLSETVEELWFRWVTTTGRCQAALPAAPPAAAASTSSVCETAMASTPLNVKSLRLVLKFDARFE